MKQLLISTILLAVFSQLHAQFLLNPQIGILQQTITNTPSGTSSQSGTGYQIGADARIGDKFYFQPGFFYCHGVTTLLSASGGAVEQADVTRNYFKIKLMAGYNFINLHLVKIHLDIGPTYDANASLGFLGIPSIKNTDFAGGSFNFDGGIGADILFFTIELGDSYGLSNVFNTTINSNSHYNTPYVSVGITMLKF
jgi:hypothetical protein